MGYTQPAVRLLLLTTVFSSLALVACVNTRGPGNPDASVDAGPPPPDAPPVPYDPILGMPFTGPLLLDDARVMSLNPATLREGDAPCHAPALVQVLRGVDGDTIHVAGLDGSPDTDIRLIGVDAPEVAHPPDPADCYSAESRDFVRMNLSGRYVWLTFGNGTSCLDPFGRTLAYVFLGAGERDMVQRQMLQRGLVKAYIFRDNATYEALFTADEAAARDANVGLWGACPAP